MRLFFVTFLLLTSVMFGDVKYDTSTIQEKMLIQAEQTTDQLRKLNESLNSLIALQSQLNQTITRMEHLMKDIHTCTVPYVRDQTGQEVPWTETYHYK